MSNRSPWIEKLAARWKAVLAEPNDSPRKIIGVAVVLCLVCSLLVSVAAVGLRPLQKRNQELKLRRNVLKAAGLWQEEFTNENVDQAFKSIEAILEIGRAHV
jgi:Na+-transporting NADH:ubiquinone oxidoreductase subunit C